MILGAILMLLLSVLLSWLPLLGPLIAGGVGGYYAGTVGRALAAALLPAVLLALFIGWVATSWGHAIAGFLVGVGVFILVVVDEVGLLLGALVGGAIAQRRKPSGAPGSAA